MIICADRFEYSDPNDPFYSMVEIDIYAWIPGKFKEANHRLSVRKNIFSKQFEAYRSYHRAPHAGKYEVVFWNASLEDVLDFTNEAWNKYHSEWAKRERLDQACKHAEPVKSMFCARNRRRW